MSTKPVSEDSVSEAEPRLLDLYADPGAGARKAILNVGLGKVLQRSYNS